MDNHAALVEFFQDLGYDNKCYVVKKDKKHRQMKLMKEQFMCQRQLNCFKEFRDYVLHKKSEDDKKDESKPESIKKSSIRRRPTELQTKDD